jgi:hypothetical protein
MSELKVREFAARAEELVDLPDLTELEHRGRDLHRRRVATVAALAAGVLVAGAFVSLRNEPPESTGPVQRPDTDIGGVRPYPGPEMKDLAPGTYSMDISSDPYFPTATVTVPKGWNSWEGPNRFRGLNSVANNEKALENASWYAGALVLDVKGVSSQRCTPPALDAEVGPTAASLVRAIREIPGYRVRVDPVPSSMFDRPATHLRLVPTPSTRSCDFNIFNTSQDGVIAGGADREDVWVVDVDGHPVVVDAQVGRGTPLRVQRELEGIVDSIEFHASELSVDD